MLPHCLGAFLLLLSSSTRIEMVVYATNLSAKAEVLEPSAGWFHLVKGSKMIGLVHITMRNLIYRGDCCGGIEIQYGRLKVS